MNNAAANAATNVDVKQRAALRMLLFRRRRVIKRVVIFAVATLGMIIVSMMHRDAQTVWRLEKETMHLPRVFQEKYGSHGLPTNLPPPPGLSAEHEEAWRSRYIYVRSNQRIAQSDHPKVICYSDPQTSLYLRANGRIVVLYDGRTYSLVWMKARDFQARAADLGVPDLTEY